MGILSNLFDFLKDFWVGLIAFLEKYLLVIILIVVAIYFMNPELLNAIITWIVEAAATVGGWLVTAATTVGGWIATFVSAYPIIGPLTLWYLADPEGMVETITELTTAAVDIAADALGTFASAVSEGLGLPTLAAVAVGLWFFFGRDKGEDRPQTGGA